MKDTIRPIALLLALCLTAAALSACSFVGGTSGGGTSQTEPEDSYESLSHQDLSGSSDYTPIESRYSYQQLSDAQKKLYDQLYENVWSVSAEKDDDTGLYPMPSVRVAGRLSVAEMRVAVRALTNDNPYLFWFAHTFSHLWEPDANYTEVYAYSEFSPDKLADMTAEVDKVLEDFYASVPSGLDEYQREKFVHDYIIDRCEYDTEVADMEDENEQSVIGHSIYGALVKKSCVCEGYGTAMQLLLNGLGVECVTLTGMSYDSSADGSEDDSELHLWNAVKLGGSWYHVDPTWDDQDEELQRYDYFNLSDKVLFEDHTLSKTPDEISDEVIEEEGTEDMNLFIPECSKMDLNYYVYECVHLTDFDGYEVKNALYEAAGGMADHFTFYVDPAYIDYDEAISELFTESPQYFFDYVDYANERLYDYEIDKENLSYFTDEKLCSIIVELSYY